MLAMPQRPGHPRSPELIYSKAGTQIYLLPNQNTWHTETSLKRRDLTLPGFAFFTDAQVLEANVYPVTWPRWL